MHKSKTRRAGNQAGLPVLEESVAGRNPRCTSARTRYVRFIHRMRGVDAIDQWHTQRGSDLPRERRESRIVRASDGKADAEPDDFANLLSNLGRMFGER